MTVSEKIQEVMDWSGFNQKKLSDLSGIPQSTLSGYLNAGDKITVDVLRKIADALNVSLWTLLNGEPLAVRPMDLTEQERRVVGEYRLLSGEEQDFIDHAFRVFNQKKHS